MTLENLYRYAYIAPHGNYETLQKFKLRVYNTLHTMAAATRNEDEATTSGHTIDAGVEKSTYGLGIGGNRIHVVHRGT